MTVVLPYSPVGKFLLWIRISYTSKIHKYLPCIASSGTMERVVKEGQVATAATYAHMFSSLPSCGRPTRLMVYDLHTLQNRFYLVRKK
jgi:hypothetical protein